MQTLLDLDDDILALARKEAERRRISVGAAVSAMARVGLTRPVVFERSPSGIAVLPLRAGGGPVTMEMVNALREDEYDFG